MDKAAAPAPDGTGNKRIPLTEAQKEIWLASRLHELASSAFNESTILHLRGPLDAEAMKSALRGLVHRYEALRTTFDLSGDYQHIGASGELDLSVCDYSGLADKSRDLAELLDAEARTPFNLERGPLFRAKMIKLSDDDHKLVTTAHHIVCDGWSFDVMMRDLAKAYNILSEGRPDDRPLPGMQISDYARWQENNKNSPEVVSAENYWIGQFSGSVPVVELPCDRPRPPIKTYRGARRTQILNDPAYAKIKKVGAKQGATLFTTLLSAFAVLLHRFTGQEELVIGILAAGQSVIGSHDLVGHCTNLLPLRLQIRGRETFPELLARTKSLVLDAYDNQAVTFGRLINRLKLKRDPSRTPLVSVLFNVDPEIHGMQFKGLEMDYVANPRRAYQFDLGFNLIAGSHKLVSECDYTTDLFDSATIDRWLGHYHTLISNIAENPDKPVEKIPILSDSESQRIVFSWNETSAEYPPDRCLHHLFEQQAARVPEAVAVVDGNGSVSYRDLNERSDRLAHYLRSAGVKAETIVGVFMERSVDTVAAILGIMKAGGAYLPLDPMFPEERLAFMLEDSAAAMILTQTELFARLPAHKAKVIDIRENRISAPGPDRSPEGGVHPGNLAYLMYTSGSTGKPKGVQIPHRAVVNFLLSMQKEPGFSEKDTLLSVTTLSFDISVLEVFLPLVSGGRTVLVSREAASDGKLLSADIARYHPTVMQATPVTWRILLESGWNLNGRMKALVGGESFPAELCSRLLRQGLEVWNMYGPTETTVWSTLKKMDTAQDRISIGRPIANTKTYVLDKNLSPVPIGVAGELYIGGDGLARGYLNRAELTSEKFMRNPFSKEDSRIYRTGDLALYLPNGDLECLGRTDFQIKVRGFRVETGEIEAVLNRHPQTAQCAVVARPDPLGENQLAAFIVPRNASTPSVSDLKQHLRQSLPEYMVPSRFLFIEQMPLTPNGKVNRRGLPDPGEGMQDAPGKTYVAANNPLEMQLAKIWESVLGVKAVGIRDNFFDLGGHSLLAVRLFSRIEKTMGLDLPLATLLKAPTVESLAKTIRDKNWDAGWTSLVPIQPGGSKPPLFFVHGAGGNVLLFRELALNLGPDQPFYGFQSKGVNGRDPAHFSFEEMAAHYIQEMRLLQPEGPYHLGGYCLGGAIALEMARQLTEKGQEVSLLAMIETYNLHAGKGILPYYYELYHKVQNVKFHLDNLWILPMKDKVTFLSKKSLTELTRMKEKARIALHLIARKLRLPSSEKYPHVNLTRINDAAYIKYTPKTYRGRITLFRPKKHYSGYTLNDFGWGEVAQGGVDVRTLPVNPRGSLVEPFVQELARELALSIAGTGEGKSELGNEIGKQTNRMDGEWIHGKLKDDPQDLLRVEAVSAPSGPDLDAAQADQHQEAPPYEGVADSGGSRQHARGVERMA
ncbi:MAG: non-ribosomal peptide synthetase [Desulfobacteraceae bacterium]|nr:MAG: non-ribosomal peptide synthetase [Desulfobacteraceae bacterium]